MTQTTLFERSAEDTALSTANNRHGYAANLAAVLGDGADWEYRGDCNERQYADGKCACGHAGIRFEFMIHHKTENRSVIVGSSCINSYSAINPDMVNAIAADVERLERAAAERLKAAKAAAQETEIQQALDEYDAIAWELDRRLSEGAESYPYRRGGEQVTGYVQRRRVKRELYFNWSNPSTAATRWHDRQLGQRHPTSRWKQYKLKSAFLRAIRAEIERVKVLADGRIWE